MMVNKNLRKYLKSLFKKLLIKKNECYENFTFITCEMYKNLTYGWILILN